MKTRILATATLILVLIFGAEELLHAQNTRRSVRTASVSSSSTVVIKMGSDMIFHPKTLTISAGETVEWKNIDTGGFHNAVDDPKHADNPKGMSLPEGAKPFDSGYMKPGQTYKHTFTAPGTYHYACTMHDAEQMFGVIIVK